MAYSQRWVSERWPEVRNDDRTARSGRGSRPDEDPDDYDEAEYREPRPIVNPYAVVALVAALLLLFPVALVFGLIAFSHPKGRVMALFALLLGLAEAAAVVALVVLPGDVVSEVRSRVDAAAAQVTGTADATHTGEHEQPAPPSTTPAPVHTATGLGTAAETPPAAGPTPLVPVAELGTACPEAGLIGNTATGATLLCLADATSSTGYQWSGPHTVAAQVKEGGTSCATADTLTARTADGRALVCERSVWVLWTD